MDIIKIGLKLDSEQAVKNLERFVKKLNKISKELGVKVQIPTTIQQSFLTEIPKARKKGVVGDIPTTFSIQSILSTLGSSAEEYQLFAKKFSKEQVAYYLRRYRTKTGENFYLMFDKEFSKFLQEKIKIKPSIPITKTQREVLLKFGELQKLVQQVSRILPEPERHKLLPSLRKLQSNVEEYISNLIASNAVIFKKEHEERTDLPFRKANLEQKLLNLQTGILNQIDSITSKIYQSYTKATPKFYVDERLVRKSFEHAKLVYQNLMESVETLYAYEAIATGLQEPQRLAKIQNIKSKIPYFGQQFAGLIAAYEELMKVPENLRTEAWYRRATDLTKKTKAFSSQLTSLTSEITGISRVYRGIAVEKPEYEINRYIESINKTFEYYKELNERFNIAIKNLPLQFPGIKSQVSTIKETLTELGMLQENFRKIQESYKKSLEFIETKKAQRKIADDTKQTAIIQQKYLNDLIQIAARSTNATRAIIREFKNMTQTANRMQEVMFESTVGYYATETAKRVSWLSSWMISWQIVFGTLTQLRMAWNELVDAQYYWYQSMGVLGRSFDTLNERINLNGVYLQDLITQSANFGYDLSTSSRLVYEATQIFGKHAEVLKINEAVMKGARLAGIQLFEAEQALFPILKLIGDTGKQASNALGMFLYVQNRTGMSADVLMQSVSQVADAIMGLSRNAKEAKEGLMLTSAMIGVIRSYAGTFPQQDVERFLRIVQTLSDPSKLRELSKFGVNVENINTILFDLFKRSKQEQQAILTALGLSEREASLFYRAASKSKEILSLYKELQKGWGEFGNYIESRWEVVAQSLRVSLNVLLKQFTLFLVNIIKLFEPGLSILVKILAGALGLINKGFSIFSKFYNNLEKLGIIGKVLYGAFKGISLIIATGLLTGIVGFAGAVIRVSGVLSRVQSVTLAIADSIKLGYQYLSGQISIYDTLIAKASQIKAIWTQAFGMPSTPMSPTTQTKQKEPMKQTQFFISEPSRLSIPIIAFLFSAVSDFAYRMMSTSEDRARETESTIKKAIESFKTGVITVIPFLLVAYFDKIVQFVKTSYAILTSSSLGLVGLLGILVGGAAALTVKLNRELKNKDQKFKSEIQRLKSSQLVAIRERLEEQLRYSPFVDPEMKKEVEKKLRMVNQEIQRRSLLFGTERTKLKEEVQAISQQTLFGISEYRDYIEKAFEYGRIAPSEYINLLKENLKSSERALKEAKKKELINVYYSELKENIEIQFKIIETQIEANENLINFLLTRSSYLSQTPMKFTTEKGVDVYSRMLSLYQLSVISAQAGKIKEFEMYSSAYDKISQQYVEYYANYAENLIENVKVLMALNDKTYLKVAEQAWAYAVYLYQMSQYIPGSAGVEAQKSAISLAQALLELGISIPTGAKKIAESMIKSFYNASENLIKIYYQSIGEIYAMAYESFRKYGSDVGIYFKILEKVPPPKIPSPKDLDKSIKNLKKISLKLPEIGKKTKSASSKQEDWFELQMKVFDALERIRTVQLQYFAGIATALPQKWFQNLKTKIYERYISSLKKGNWLEASRMIGFLEEIRQKEIDLLSQNIEKRYKIDLSYAQMYEDKVKEALIQYKIANEKYRLVLKHAAKGSMKEIEARMELIQATFNYQRALLERSLEKTQIQRRISTIGFVSETRKSYVELQNAIDRYFNAVKLYGQNSIQALTERAEVLEQRFNYYRSVLDRREQILQSMIDLGYASNQQLASFYQQMIAITSNDLLTQLEYKKKLKDLYNQMNQNIEEAIGLPSVRVPTPYEIRRAFIDRLTQNIQININVNNSADMSQITNALQQILQIPGGAFLGV